MSILFGIPDDPSSPLNAALIRRVRAQRCAIVADSEYGVRCVRVGHGEGGRAARTGTTRGCGWRGRRGHSKASGRPNVVAVGFRHPSESIFVSLFKWVRWRDRPSCGKISFSSPVPHRRAPHHTTADHIHVRSTNPQSPVPPRPSGVRQTCGMPPLTSDVWYCAFYYSFVLQ